MILMGISILRQHRLRKSNCSGPTFITKKFHVKLCNLYLNFDKNKLCGNQSIMNWNLISVHVESLSYKRLKTQPGQEKNGMRLYVLFSASLHFGFLASVHVLHQHHFLQLTLFVLWFWLLLTQISLWKICVFFMVDLLPGSVHWTRNYFFV